VSGKSPRRPDKKDTSLKYSVKIKSGRASIQDSFLWDEKSSFIHRFYTISYIYNPLKNLNIISKKVVVFVFNF